MLPPGVDVFHKDALDFRLAAQTLMLDVAFHEILSHLLEGAGLGLRLLGVGQELAGPLAGFFELEDGVAAQLGGGGYADLLAVLAQLPDVVRARKTFAPP